MSAERAYNTSKEASEVLVGSLLGSNDLNYLAHKGCVRRSSDNRRKQQELADKAVLLRRKYLVYMAGLNRPRRATENGAWFTALPHRLNGTEFSWNKL